MSRPFLPNPATNKQLLWALGIAGGAAAVVGTIVYFTNKSAAAVAPAPALTLPVFVPRGSTSNGSTSNGSTSNGSTSNGSTSNGSTSNGSNGGPPPPPGSQGGGQPPPPPPASSTSLLGGNSYTITISNCGGATATFITNIANAPIPVIQSMLQGAATVTNANVTGNTLMFTISVTNTFDSSIISAKFNSCNINISSPTPVPPAPNGGITHNPNQQPPSSTTNNGAQSSNYPNQQAVSNPGIFTVNNRYTIVIGSCNTAGAQILASMASMPTAHVVIALQEAYNNVAPGVFYVVGALANSSMLSIVIDALQTKDFSSNLSTLALNLANNCSITVSQPAPMTWSSIAVPNSMQTVVGMNYRASVPITPTTTAAQTTALLAPYFSPLTVYMPTDTLPTDWPAADITNDQRIRFDGVATVAFHIPTYSNTREYVKS